MTSRKCILIFFIIQFLCANQTISITRWSIQGTYELVFLFCWRIFNYSKSILHCVHPIESVKKSAMGYILLIRIKLFGLFCRNVKNVIVSIILDLRFVFPYCVPRRSCPAYALCAVPYTLINPLNVTYRNVCFF